MFLFLFFFCFHTQKSYVINYRLAGLVSCRTVPSPIAQSGLENMGSLVRFPARQYSFRGFMRVNATGFIPLSPLALTIDMWKSSQWLGNYTVRTTG